MEKFCRCGCCTPIKESKTWVQGHNAKHGVGPDHPDFHDPNPSGLCLCGCGQPTSIARWTNVQHGVYRGQHYRYRVGHSTRMHIGAARGGQWKGGRIVTDEGYIKVRIGERGARSYRLEHRVVMEQTLGRSLAKHENVHHLNGNRQDNRPENLELWNKPQTCGIRAADYHCPGCRCMVAS